MLVGDTSKATRDPTSVVEQVADGMVGISNAKEKDVCILVCSRQWLSSWPSPRDSTTYST